MKNMTVKDARRFISYYEEVNQMIVNYIEEALIA